MSLEIMDNLLHHLTGNFHIFCPKKHPTKKIKLKVKKILTIIVISILLFTLNAYRKEKEEPAENAIAKRVNGILKGELLEEAFCNFEVAHLAIVCSTYNHIMPHGSIDNLKPLQARQQKGEIKKRWKNYWQLKKEKEVVMDQVFLGINRIRNKKTVKKRKPYIGLLRYLTGLFLARCSSAEFISASSSSTNVNGI